MTAPDAAMLWARQNQTQWGSETARAEAFRAGQAHERAEIVALQEEVALLRQAVADMQAPKPPF
jgi:hypothetical protein